LTEISTQHLTVLTVCSIIQKGTKAKSIFTIKVPQEILCVVIATPTSIDGGCSMMMS